MTTPRKLEQNDVERMQIPPRYWNSQIEKVEAMVEAHGMPVRPLSGVLETYVEQIDEQLDAGNGIVLYGNNGRGKTAALVWLGMQIRRRGYSVLYVETAKLKDIKIQKVPFSTEETLWERLMTVDVLVLDDLGKGVSDSKGFMQELVDEIIRTRGAHLRTTLISSNVDPAKLMTDDFLKKSTLAMMQETVAFLHVVGEDIRRRARMALVNKLVGESDGD